MRLNFSYVIDGHLAGMSLPGRNDDVLNDLSFIRDQGIGAVVSLTVVSLDQAQLRESEFRFLHLPVRDFQSPTLEQVEQFVDFVNECRTGSGGDDSGCAVVAHCGAGMGRTGTMLACYLVSREAPPGTAIKKIRALRPGSLETAVQEDVVFAYAAALGHADSGRSQSFSKR